MDTPGSAPAAPAPSADSAAAATKPPVAAAPPTGDSPRPDDGKPALSPEEQRLRDTQKWGHTKAEEAAAAKKENEGLLAENAELKGKLVGLMGDQRFTAVPEPEEVTFGDDAVSKLYDEYSEVGEDKQAFGLLVGKTLEMAEQRIANQGARERAKQENQARFNRLVTEVRNEITETIKAAAPDVDDMELFWAMCAPQAARMTPPNLTTPVDRWEWQMRKGVELYRQRFGGRRPAPDTPSPETDPHAIRRPATAVVSAGSLQPRGGQPSRGPRTMVEQMGALQERILPGARRK